MTEEELKAIERGLDGDINGLITVNTEDMRALVAEVRRLRGPETLQITDDQGNTWALASPPHGTGDD